MLDETSAVFGRKRSVERRDNAGGQGPIETKRISDRKDFLTNTQVVTRADRDGSNTLRKLHAEHGQVVCRAHAHERGTSGHGRHSGELWRPPPRRRRGCWSQRV